jgi:two-component system response regulator RstA
MQKPFILMVEDNQSFAKMVQEFLESNGFLIAIERRGDRAPERILSESPSLVLLDIMLPGMDGLTVCRQVRELYPGPILMLTSLDEEVDEVTGLQTGADDYVIKPIRPHALLARIQNLLTRTSQRFKRAKQMKIGSLVIDSGSRSVARKGEIVELSAAEFDLLWLLAQNAGNIVTRDGIYQALRGIDYDGMDRTMDVRIGRLRKKLGDEGRDPQIIKSVRGEGYLLTESS